MDDYLNQQAMARRFKTSNGDIHLVDDGGNHFVNNKCVNPTKKSGGNIGDTIPAKDKQLPWIKVTGSVPYRVDNEGNFIRL
jgi:hypothetical protein